LDFALAILDASTESQGPAMQVDRLNHLLFPPDSAPAPLKKPSAAATQANSQPNSHATAQASARSRAPTLVDRVLPPQASVVLKLQPDRLASADLAPIDAAVYSDARKNVPVASDQVNLDKMQQEHQLALGRNAGIFTKMAVDKDGILVAKPNSAASTGPSDFVTRAVLAMRELHSENENKKSSASSLANVPESAPLPKLNSLQQLAARFKTFA
jgi:hypothetical protein